jgi:hypothetical protein
MTEVDTPRPYPGNVAERGCRSLLGLAVASKSPGARRIHAFGFYDATGFPFALCGVGRDGLRSLGRLFDSSDRRVCANCVRLFGELAAGWAGEVLESASSANTEPDEDLYRRLQFRAAAAGVTLEQLLRPLVRRFLDDELLAADVIKAAHC